MKLACALRVVCALPFALLVACSGGEDRRGETGTTTDPIIGGVADTGTGAHPNVVFLTHQGSACTGSLIAPKLVLTARHCVSQNISQGIGCDIYGNSGNGDHVGSDFTPSTIQVHTGANPGGTVATGVQVLHPPGNNLCNNDIALVVLNQAVPGVTPIKIRYTFPPAMGELGMAVGYGGTNQDGNGAGSRRRRANVPVISVGQDWNELNGANEFTAGQAVCPGDSGGPLLSAGGAVIGVASRVSDCEDASASAKYVRLDQHKALIDQAFAAAGATPSVETGTPTTITKKPTGQGPCSTGAECSAFLCSKGSNSFCTEFCATGVPPNPADPCDAGSYCTDSTVEISGELIDEQICLPLPTGTACEACRSTECVNLVSTCLNKPECKTLLDCVDACTDQACVEGCIDANPNGELDYGDVASCACNSSCADECSHQCIEPPAGGGGSSGAGATGGVTSGGGTGNLGGTGAVGGTGGTGAGPNTNPVDSGDSGGCNVKGRPNAPWWLLSLLLFGVRRRKVG